jgi:toxin ParE1/3/4
MEIRWSPQAFDDLERIFKRIRKDNPEAARQVTGAIYRECTELQSFPNHGRPSRVRGRREFVISRLPYIVVYQVKTEAVEISRIYPAAQDWP